MGGGFGAEEARAISGIATVLWLDSLWGLLQGWMHVADSVILNTNENDRRSGPAITREYRFIEEMQERVSRCMYTDVARRYCGVCEASRQLLEVSIDAGGGGNHRRDIWGCVAIYKAGGEWNMRSKRRSGRGLCRRRSPGPAYESIVAGGDRARTLHYIANNGVL